MNKKAIIFATILLMFFVVGIASVFADDTVRTYEVTVSYKDKVGRISSVTYELSASSPAEAQRMAKEKCEYEKIGKGSGNGEIISCGAAIPKTK